MENGFTNLLKAFDLQVSSMEVTTKALMSLFQYVPTAIFEFKFKYNYYMSAATDILTIVIFCSTTSDEIASETLKSLMDEINIIPYDKLTAESAFFWRCYVFFSSDLVSEKNNYNWESSKSYDATQNGLLPDLSVFCEYIKM